MRKIPTLFMRDEVSRGQALARNEINPECQWVADGKGVATIKWDGTCCRIMDGKLYKRMEWDGSKGPAPACWVHHDRDPDQRSGHGWYPVGDGPEDWMHRKAWERGVDDVGDALCDGTYELIGPKIGKNPEGVEDYALVPHGRDKILAPRDFDGLRQWLSDLKAEGIVWHHPDGRMAKLKRRDFGIPWPVKR